MDINSMQRTPTLHLIIVGNAKRAGEKMIGITGKIAEKRSGYVGVLRHRVKTLSGLLDYSREKEPLLSVATAPRHILDCWYVSPAPISRWWMK